jgi:hypothetical protein
MTSDARNHTCKDITDRMRGRPLSTIRDRSGSRTEDLTRDHERGRANISFAAATPSCMQSSFLPDPAQYQLDTDLHVITYGSDRQLEKFVGGCAKETRKAISPVAAAYVSDRHGTKSHGAGV